jgi:DNA-binding LacI/PurR family transcriptional regulator
MLRLQIQEGDGTPIYGRIADAVCEAVLSGRTAPGEKLPTETSLAADLGINRLTVSRAYEHLQGRGIILQRRGSGTFVASDALRRLQAGGRRRIATVAYVLGAKALSECVRELLFISVDILDGVREVLGERETRITLLDGLTRAHAEELSEADAVVLQGGTERDATLLNDLIGRGTPMVSVWEDRTSRRVPYVDYDRYQSAGLACRHLVQCGYRRIGFIGMKTYPQAPVAPKFGALASVLHEHGMDVHARCVRHVSVAPGKAYAAAREVIDSGDLPEAFFVDTDYKAMEVIHALSDAGIKVPQDVGIVSYDDIPGAAAFEPALTTVRVPRREIGRRAARMLLDWPEDGATPGNVLLTSELVVRNSTNVRKG